MTESYPCHSPAVEVLCEEHVHLVHKQHAWAALHPRQPRAGLSQQPPGRGSAALTDDNGGDLLTDVHLFVNLALAELDKGAVGDESLDIQGLEEELERFVIAGGEVFAVARAANTNLQADELIQREEYS